MPNRSTTKPTARLKLVARDVRPDSRHRISLGDALKDLGDVTFAIYRDEEGGNIVLEPHVSVPAAEAWLFRNKRALDSVARGLAQFAKGQTSGLGSFAEFADDDDET